jgi:GTP-binding protein HflX
MVDQSHRGAFGEHGGESGAFIERTFRERIIVVGVDLPPHDTIRADASLDELELLVDTAGADVVERVMQRRRAPDPATFVGKGKVVELRDIADAVDADTVVFDDELTPAQQFNLEKLLGRSTIDRTAVILDIFAQNAHSQEGMAQVALAQYRYRLPRLRGKGSQMSQQAGGIGTRRGPGETQFEVDRRRIERRIHKLEADLRTIAGHRRTQRKARRRADLPTVAIVGYTNAGKSTLLNRLTDADVLVENRLFATLDATTRRLRLPGGETVLATDTVGFVTKLPHELVEAFKSTLEVVAEADLLIHVVDASTPDPDLHIAAVREVLREIQADGVPELLAFNKADLDDADAAVLNSHPEALSVSARTGVGVDELLRAVSDRLRMLTQVVELCIPYDRGDIVASVHRDGEVLVETASEGGLRLRARLADATATRLDAYVVD